MKICENLAMKAAINTEWTELWIFHDSSVYTLTILIKKLVLQVFSSHQNRQLIKILQVCDTFLFMKVHWIKKSSHELIQAKLEQITDFLMTWQMLMKL